MLVDSILFYRSLSSPTTNDQRIVLTINSPSFDRYIRKYTSAMALTYFAAMRKHFASNLHKVLKQKLKLFTDNFHYLKDRLKEIQQQPKSILSFLI